MRSRADRVAVRARIHDTAIPRTGSAVPLLMTLLRMQHESAMRRMEALQAAAARQTAMLMQIVERTQQPLAAGLHQRAARTAVVPDAEPLEGVNLGVELTHAAQSTATLASTTDPLAQMR